MEGLFTTLNNKLKTQCNKTIKSLQFQMLVRWTDKNTEKWIGRPRLATLECNYKEIDKQLKKQFIHGLNDNDILVKIIRELTKTEEGSDVTSEQVLVWAKDWKAKNPTVIITSTSETKDFDKVRTVKGRNRQYEEEVQTCAKMPTNQRYRYSGSTHLSRRCLAYGKSVQHVERSTTSERSAEVEEIEPSMT